MTRLRIGGVLAALALALFASVALAQGVTVFIGTVTIDGIPAPAGTTVNVMIAGEIIGTSTTGATGLSANQYRIDIQAIAAWENQTASVVVPGTFQATPATAVFNAGRVRTVNVVATTPAIPSLTEWGMIALGVAFAGAMLFMLRPRAALR